MISKYLIILISVTIFLFLIALVLYLSSEKEKTVKNGEEKTPIKRWNPFQGWGVKRVIGWAFVVFLLFEFGMWVLDIDFSLIRKLISFAYRNNPAHVSKMIGQRAMAEEVKPYREELERIKSKDTPSQKDFARSKELEIQIANIEAKYDSVNKAQSGRKVSVRDNVWFVIKYQDKKGNEQTRQMKAKIEKLDENVLEVSYQSKCVGQGRVQCDYSLEQGQWIGTWQDAKGGGDVILERKDVGLVGYINNNPASRVWIKKS